MRSETVTILLELLCVVAVVAFCVVVWWPAALLVIALAAGFAAWNRERVIRK
jgi:hypothetical protein